MYIVLLLIYYTVTDTWFIDCDIHLTVQHDSRIEYFHYCLFIPSILLCSWRSDCLMIIFYFITLYARAPHFLFYTHWKFWLPEFAQSGLCMLSCWSDIWRRSHVLRGTIVLFVRSSDLGIISWHFCLFLLILYIVWTQFILLIIHRIVISCIEIYISYYSDIWYLHSWLI